VFVFTLSTKALSLAVLLTNKYTLNLLEELLQVIDLDVNERALLVGDFLLYEMFKLKFDL
jgi:hypothetical protein